MKTKRVSVESYGGPNNALATGALEASWTYDNEGRQIEERYPLGGPLLRTDYDAAGRMDSLVRFEWNAALGRYEDKATLVNNVQYNPAGQWTQLAFLGYTETRSYNERLQLTRLTASGAGPGMDMEYRYSATQNDGRITHSKDWVTGEEVTYGYDQLKRLISAVTTGPEWGLSFAYDGFGNLLSQTVTKGSGPYFSLNVNFIRNRVNGWSYDKNGNVTYDGSQSYSYDVENRRTNGGTGI